MQRGPIGLQRAGARTGGSGIWGHARTGVLALACFGTRSSSAHGHQNERLRGGWALERVVLGPGGFQGAGRVGSQRAGAWTSILAAGLTKYRACACERALELEIRARTGTWRGRALERALLVACAWRVGLERAGSRTSGSGERVGSRTSGSGERFWRAGWFQNEWFWGGRALERAVLRRPGSRTGSSSGVWVPGKGGSAPGGFQNGWFWHWDTRERGSLAQARRGTRSSGANGHQNEWFWGSQAHTYSMQRGTSTHTYSMQHSTSTHTHSTARVRTHTARHEHAHVDTACNTAAGARTHRYSRQHGTHTMARHDAVHMHPVSLTSWILLVSLVQHRMEWQAEKPPVATVQHARTCHHAAHYDTHAHSTPRCSTPRHARTGRATMQHTTTRTQHSAPQHTCSVVPHGTHAT
jgi:hypothetical protein